MTSRALVVILALAVGSCARRDVALPAPPPPPLAIDAPPTRPAPAPVDAPAAPPDVPPEAPVEQPGPEHRHASSGDRHGSIGRLTVAATVPKADVAKVLHGHMAALRACYEDELDGKASKGGTVDLSLTISDRGAVTLARVRRSTLAGGDPEMCIVKKLGELRFPKPSDGQDAPLSFTLEVRGTR